MNKEWLYGFTTSVKERSLLLRKHYKDIDMTPHVVAWRKRKTLVSDENFNDMLANNNLTEQEFGLGVKPLTEMDLKILFEYVSQKPWYIRHKDILKSEAVFTPIGLESALHFHLFYTNRILQNYLSNTKILHLEPNVLVCIENALKEDLISIAQRTLVWDVYDIKKRMKISSENKEDELATYLNIRFSSSYKTELFFMEYPTLSRLLSDRVQYFIDNILFFFESLVSSVHKLRDTFALNFPYRIQQFQISSGDSHSFGKKPIIFTLNNKKLVFKYHSGDNLLSYNKLLSYIETIKPDFKLSKVRCVSSINYSIEEYITHAACETDSDIEKYYQNYGNLVALLHFLGTTDIHMENLIAHYSSPVLIDTETLLAVENCRTSTVSNLKNRLIEDGSVVSSGLLPMQKYWKRQLDISALNGTEQKLPYKVRKLKNGKTSDIMYQLEEAVLTPSQNMPILLTTKIPYYNYTHLIEGGYLSMMKLLKENHTLIHSKCIELFSNTEIRVLLRDTQDYQNYIVFSTHPSCMVDYIEREKIFENLWENSFINSSIVNLEVKALLEHDIPYFISQPFSLDIHTTNNFIKSFFTKCIMDVLSTHIDTLLQRKVPFSHLLLKESLNMLQLKNQTFQIPDINPEIKLPLLHNAVNIGDQIVDSIEINEKHNMVIWPYLILDKQNHIDITFPDSNIYNGSAGLYLYLYMLDEIFPKPTYKQALQIIEKEVAFSNAIDSIHHSAYRGLGIQITVAFILYLFTKASKYLKLLKKVLYILYKNLDKIISVEWLNGSSSLISLLVTIHNELSLPIAKKIVISLVNAFTIPDVQLPGFAHGYSGMLYALVKAEPLIHSSRINELIDELYNLTLESLSIQNYVLTDSWCNGTTGINKALYTYYELRGISPITVLSKNKVTNSCLCHGTFGVFTLTLENYKKHKITYDQYIKEAKRLFERDIILKSDNLIIPIDLFTGLSGIGYQILAILYPDKILNILFL